MQPLPIDPLLPEIAATLADTSRLVLCAPPGAGKTTRVPAALLDAGLARDKHVLVLEPRRIAARAAAEFVARERGGTVGDAVGYRVRFEQRGGPGTRVWFVTEGVLGRQLARDPFLEHAGIVVLDEFHERHLQGDVALGVICELQETVRPDLKLVVMSATLETQRLAAHLGNCPVLTSAGRAYPVEIEYEPARDGRPLSVRVATALTRILSTSADAGDVLVFLPGSAEIRRAAAALEPIVAAQHLDVVLLHGDMPLDAQQRAIVRGRRRKVVLSTNVAETALTIEGVTSVIDSGLARVAWLDTKHGINTLRVMPISRAAADQRAGRAGRTAPGRCLRLWTQAEHLGRREREVPEVLRLDLAATVLELRAWGLSDPRQLHWLDAPGAATLQRAEELLLQLGAVDGLRGAVSPIGRRMLELAVPPRLARMLIEAERAGAGAAGALVAALASERDICREQRAFGTGTASPWPAANSDLLLRAQLFQEAVRGGLHASACRALDLDPPSVHTVERARRQLARALGNQPGSAVAQADEEVLLRCVLAGFPDRVVRRRAAGSPRGVMVGGTGVRLAATSVVRDAPLFVAVELDAGPRRQLSEACVRLASAVEPEWLAETFPALRQRTSEVVFDAARERVVERSRVLFSDLVLEDEIRLDVDTTRAGEVLAAALRSHPSGSYRMSEAECKLLERIRFLQRVMPELELPIDPDAWALEALTALCAGKRSLRELQGAELLPLLQHSLSAPQRQALAREAPAEYRLPTGRVAAIDYERDKAPVVSARIQELFGLTATPRLAHGRVPLVIQLLAPNHRPVQITDDLESFWRRTYPEVRKQLRGRYPKHPWPEDPFTARPTTRTKRQAAQ